MILACAGRGAGQTPLSPGLIEHRAAGRGIVDTPAVGPHLVRPDPARTDFDGRHLARQSDLIPKVELRMVQNSRDCLWKRGLPNGEIDDCRLRFRSLDLKKPSLLCELLRHRSTMRRAVARATGYPQPTPGSRKKTRDRGPALSVGYTRDELRAADFSHRSELRCFLRGSRHAIPRTSLDSEDQVHGYRYG
ncbi:MAG: hypothetical protein QOF34_1088 [Sphingomonadales bacterium]|nr:hypothetical protein [Sphingomonadales bacterium]